MVQELHLSFTDNDSISEWAEEATAWCVAHGIVGGRPDGSFDPQATANRGEVATILKNFVGNSSSDTVPETSVPESSHTELEAIIQQVEEVFSEGSLVKIEALLFGFQGLVIDEALESFLENNDTTENSTPLMSSIFKETTVKRTSVEDEYVVFEVTAPNLANIFANVANGITEDEFSAYLLKYISFRQMHSCICLKE